MDNQIINCRCGRERRNKESNLSGLMITRFFLFGFGPKLSFRGPREKIDHTPFLLSASVDYISITEQWLTSTTHLASLHRIIQGTNRLQGTSRLQAIHNTSHREDIKPRIRL